MARHSPARTGATPCTRSRVARRPFASRHSRTSSAGRTTATARRTRSPGSRSAATARRSRSSSPRCSAATASMGGAGGGILPSAAFKKVYDPYTTDTKQNIDDNPLNMNPPASMGPFVFKEFKPGIQVTLGRNDKYFRGAPLLDEFVIKVYADATAIKNALVTGEVTYGTVEAKDYEEVKKVDS